MSFFRFLINRLNHLVNRIYERDGNSITPSELTSHHILDYEKQFQKNQEAIYYSQEILQDLINKRLRALLFHAKSKSPWYKKNVSKNQHREFHQTTIRRTSYHQ
ncbi:hypothetical protein [Legionella norrlandica]|uniref:hypothetical protein n=1 Tax=Legionella norrlandica TaxID=1498499 RepID=UPI000AA66EE4|nr:hypothetical protein [Legionella norrlandica]